MERIHKTNLKTFKHPLLHREKGLDKKYRGFEYPKMTTTVTSSELGRYRGIEYKVTLKSVKASIV
jgi:hypothetical protein